MDKREQLIRLMFQTRLNKFIGLGFRVLHPQRRWTSHWSVDFIAGALVRCEQREITRLVINLPPRYLKSTAASIVFPAWILALHPEARILCIAGTQGLALQQHQQSLLLMTHPKYRALFPHVEMSESGRQLRTSHGGSRSWFTPNAGITGHGADFIIIDDPLPASSANNDVARKRINDWYDQNIYQRLDEKKKGVVIVAMQRLHSDDLTGHLIKQKNWRFAELPVIATANERFGGQVVRRCGDVLNPTLESKEQLRDAMLRMGAKAFMAQYQQNPYAPGEGEGKRGFYSELREGMRWTPEMGNFQMFMGSCTEEKILLHTVFGEGDHPWPKNMRRHMEPDEWIEFNKWSTARSQAYAEELEKIRAEAAKSAK